MGSPRRQAAWWRRVPPPNHGGEVSQVAEKLGCKPEDILDFSSSLNPLGPSPQAIEAIRRNLTAASTYPDDECMKLRRALASYLGRGLKVENIVVGNGATELIHRFTQLHCKPRGGCIIPYPTFTEYERAAILAGGRVSAVPLEEDFTLPLEKLASRMARRRLMFLGNPNNPTSSVTPQETLSEIIDRADAKGVFTLLDEDCVEFIEDTEAGTCTQLPKAHGNAFVVRSFTKVFGLAGLRIGFGVASGPMAEALNRIRQPWTVNSLALAAAEAALSDTEHVQKAKQLIASERRFLFDGLLQIPGVKPFHPRANYILVDVRGTRCTASELKAKLLRLKILIRDCTGVRGLNEYFIRVAVKRREQNEALLQALKNVCSG